VPQILSSLIIAAPLLFLGLSLIGAAALLVDWPALFRRHSAQAPRIAGEGR
jgi:hypothetical protein